MVISDHRGKDGQLLRMLEQLRYCGRGEGIKGDLYHKPYKKSNCKWLRHLKVTNEPLQVLKMKRQNYSKTSVYGKAF